MGCNGLLLEVKRLYKHYEQGGLETIIPATTDVSFRAYAGSITTITGPNGCGKSTLLKAVAGIVSPDSGYIFYHAGDGLVYDFTGSKDPQAERRRSKELYYLAQIPALDPEQSGEVVVAEAGIEAGLEDDEAHDRAVAWLDRIGLPSHLWQVPTANYSLGERQRTNVARALVGRYRLLLLLDEPFANLDGDAEAAIVTALRELADRGVGILLATPNQQRARSLADRQVTLTRSANLLRDTSV